MTRQLSFNSNHKSTSNIPLQKKIFNTPIKNGVINKRSKTETELNKKVLTTPNKEVTTTPKPKYNPQHYSPLKVPGNSPYLRQISHTKIDTSKPSIKPTSSISTTNTAIVNTRKTSLYSNNKVNHLIILKINLLIK